MNISFEVVVQLGKIYLQGKEKPCVWNVIKTWNILFELILSENDDVDVGMFEIIMITIGIIFSLFWPCWSLEIRLLVIGLYKPISLGTLPYTLPIYEIAAEHLNKRYNGSLTVVADFITDRDWTTCQDVQVDYDRLAADWYYTKNFNPGRILVLSPPGLFYVHQICMNCRK